jgi:hypothetical protein
MDLPEIIKEHGFGYPLEKYKWDNKKLWSLSLPVEEVSVKELEWILDTPWWTDGKEKYNLEPRKVIESPERYPDHQKRLETCDTSLPIDIMLNKKDNWLILDGLHRLVKLVIEGKTKVKVRKIPREFIPQIIRSEV